MTALPPALAALLQARQAAGESLPGAGPGRSGQPATAVVLALTRHGVLIESAGKRWLVSGAPPLPHGTTLTLAHTGAGAGPRPARLLAIGAHALAPPVAIRLQPVASGSREPPAAESGRPGASAVPAAARLIGPAGRPLGPAVPISLAVAPSTIPQRASPMPRAAAGTAAAPMVAPQPVETARPPALALAAAPPAAAREAVAPITAVAPPSAIGAGTRLPAAVVGRDPQGRLLLESGAIRLRLETPLDLPLGARLTLALPQGLPPPSGAPPAPAADALQRLIAALLTQETVGGETREAGGLRLPAADHALAARLLRWVQAPPAASSAPAGESAAADRPEAAGERLPMTTPELARQPREPQPGGWRVLVIPFGVEDPQILKLHLREPGADPERDARPERERSDATQRAVFEVELSHLGRCQLDVLCQAERFDLVVRSATPLDPGLEEQIRGLIAATRAAAGLTGRLEFRAAELLTLPDPQLPAGRHVMA